MNIPKISETHLNDPAFRDVEFIKSLLESGNKVLLPAAGYSMFPVLKPGDQLIIRAVQFGELPKIGSILVYNKNNILVLHRLVSVEISPLGKVIFTTRGDALNFNDLPWPEENLVGIASVYSRGIKTQMIKTMIPRKWHYWFNRLRLRIHHKTGL